MRYMPKIAVGCISGLVGMIGGSIRDKSCCRNAHFAWGETSYNSCIHACIQAAQNDITRHIHVKKRSPMKRKIVLHSKDETASILQ